jgi:ParB/RepB/Spo0J family partition protein
MSREQIEVPLSRLVPSAKNPRRVKPTREAHRRLVALIQSQVPFPTAGRASDGGPPKQYQVIAGGRRLAALKVIHRGKTDPKIPCILRDVDATTAEALALGENFGCEAMHPLDEAEAFANLATRDGKDAAAIAAEFGVVEHYVRQRMQLATLAPAIKSAYRNDQIDTGTAEAFAAVPVDRQLEVWQEVGGHPQHAAHVRNVIAHGWINAEHARFDLSTLPAAVVSRDLFGDQVLVERHAFLEAQTQALTARRKALLEAGWHEVVVGSRSEVQDRLYAMESPDREFDAATLRRLQRIADRKAKLLSKMEELGETEEAAFAKLQDRFDALQAAEEQIVRESPSYASEETKSLATMFLLIDPDGRVREECRVPRRRRTAGQRHGETAGVGPDGSTITVDRPAARTSEELNDKQRADSFTHQALGVREALLADGPARKRVLALILHTKVRSEALSIRHGANATTLASQGEGFLSPAFDRIERQRTKLGPFAEMHVVDDRDAFVRLGELSDATVDKLIDLLIVDCLTIHLYRRTELVGHLAGALNVDVRQYRRPDAAWLAGYQKIQLTHLIVALKGPLHAPAPERKKSELVAMLAKLFADAAEGTLEDKQLGERVNRWTLANLREEERASAAA